MTSKAITPITNLVLGRTLKTHARTENRVRRTLPPRDINHVGILKGCAKTVREW